MSLLSAGGKKILPCWNTERLEIWWNSCLVAFPSCALMVDFWVLFQTRIKKHRSLLGASWDLPMPNLARWPVLSCHYREISKRQPSERGREGLWFFFFLHVWIGKYKGRREHVGRFQSWQQEAWVYKWFEASDVNKLYPGWLVFLWCLVPALRGAGWFHKLRIDTVCALSSEFSTGTQPPVRCLLFSVSP